MGGTQRSVAALIIVLVVVLGVFVFYVSMCCRLWGLKQRVLKLLRWCLNCVTNTPDGDTNQTPSQRIIQSLSPWIRRAPVYPIQATENPSGAPPDENTCSLRTPPPNYCILKSPNPPTYISAVNKVPPKEAFCNGSCSNWMIVVNEKEQTVKATSGKDNLSYEDSEGNTDTRGSSGTAPDKEGSPCLELSRSNVLNDINENKIRSSPKASLKNAKKRKRSIFSNEPAATGQRRNSNFFDKCENYKIIRTWSTPFSQCQPFQSEMEKVYAGNSICHFVNTKIIVDGRKRDSVTRSFIVSPVKLDKNDDARLTSYRNIDNESDNSYHEQSNNEAQSPCSTEEVYDNSRKKSSDTTVPTLLVTDPEDNLIYQSDGISDEIFLTSVPVAS